MRIELFTPERLRVQRRTTPARTIEREMDPRFVKLLSDDVLLEIIEAYLFAGDFDAFGEEESEEEASEEDEE